MQQFEDIKTIQGAGVEILLNRIDTMSMAERIAYATRLETHMDRNGKASHQMSGSKSSSDQPDTTD